MSALRLEDLDSLLPCMKLPPREITRSPERLEGFLGGLFEQKSQLTFDDSTPIMNNDAILWPLGAASYKEFTETIRIQSLSF